MSTRAKIHSALRTGQRRGLKGRALEALVNQMAEVKRMTSAEIAVASKAYRELVYPLTRPVASQGWLDLDGGKGKPPLGPYRQVAPRDGRARHFSRPT